MKYYVVELGTGDVSGMGWKTLFITDMEYKAKWYCSKANSMIKKYESYYEDKCFNRDVGSYENFSHYHERYMLASGFFTYTATEARTEFINLKT